MRRPILEVPEVPKELVSEYQSYVTPEDLAVRNLAVKGRGIKSAYKTAVSWTWVSDATLNHVEEK